MHSHSAGSPAAAPRFALALAGFVALVVWRAPPWMVVALTALGGVALGLAGLAA